MEKLNNIDIILIDVELESNISKKNLPIQDSEVEIPISGISNYSDNISEFKEVNEAIDFIKN